MHERCFGADGSSGFGLLRQVVYGAESNVIDFSSLNGHIILAKFTMEMVSSVLG